MITMPNPFESTPGDRFLLDEEAFMEAIEPPPLFLGAPRYEPVARDDVMSILKVLFR